MNIITNIKCVSYFFLSSTLLNQILLNYLQGMTDFVNYINKLLGIDFDDQVGIEADWLTTEFLNDMRCSGIPDHKLVLKKGVPIMLMRNLEISAGLCNGTRLIVDELHPAVIGAIVITGTHVGNKVYIPRMTLMPSDQNMAIKFQRKQFPIAVSFAMTINKSQGQSLGHVAVFLPKPVFSHGQLYVAISRVTTKAGLKILVCDENCSKINETKNIVYREVFQKIYNP